MVEMDTIKARVVMQDLSGSESKDTIWIDVKCDDSHEAILEKIWGHPLHGKEVEFTYALIIMGEVVRGNVFQLLEEPRTCCCFPLQRPPILAFRTVKKIELQSERTV